MFSPDIIPTDATLIGVAAIVAALAGVIKAVAMLIKAMKPPRRKT